MKHLLLIQTLLLLSGLTNAQSLPESITMEDKTFQSESGVVVNARAGSLTVPENRSNPDSENITVHFVLLKGTNPSPKAPLFYLEGGPGQSCTWQADDPHYLERWLPFLEVCDVILLDQRGTGEGAPRVTYIVDKEIPTGILADEKTRNEYLRTLSQAAQADLKSRGVALEGYTTRESAQDIDALRKSLSLEKLSLLGFSYGTHLGLTYLKYYGEHVEDAVLVGVEGLGHTFKLPSTLDTQFRKIALLAQADPNINQAVPDLLTLYERVINTLEANPVELAVTSPLTGAPLTVRVGPFGLNLLLLIDMGDATDIPVFPRLLYSINQGDYSVLRWFVQKRIGNFYGVQGMAATMDLASGGSLSRRQRIKEELTKSRFRDILSAQLEQDWPFPDLGEAFRTPLVSSVRTLFMSGTLDYNTPPFQAEEVRWGFPNSSHLVVDNAGHEQLLTHPEAIPTIVRFLKGETVDDVTLSYPTLVFIPVRGSTDSLSHPAVGDY